MHGSHNQDIEYDEGPILGFKVTHLSMEFIPDRVMPGGVSTRTPSANAAEQQRDYGAGRDEDKASHTPVRV